MTWRLSVLGPVELSHEGVPTAAMPPKQQAALLILAGARGRTVSVEELVDGIWGERRPPSALGALRNYAWALRKRFAAGTHAVRLTSGTGGYRLDGAVELDTDLVDRFRVEVEQLRIAGDLDRAESVLEAALGQWRGDPLTGVPGPWAEAERARLRRLHRVLCEDRVELAVAAQDYPRAITDLEGLITADPLSERLRGLMMTALYRAGRRTEALEEYQRIRRLLVADQGIEPGPALIELHQRILTDELPTVAAGAPAPLPVPAQLPPDTADFTGRREAVERLCDELRDDLSLPIAAVSGMGGVGKTTLALHVAHRMRARFPDGQLYVDLHGAAALPADPGQVLGGFLRALGVPDWEMPAGVDERAALFRSTVSGRRLLLVLDDAFDGAQIAPLLPGTPGSAVLVTARRPLTALPGARPTALGVLARDEAEELFARIVGVDRAAAEPEASRRVVELCGLLPLAIRIVAARVAARPTWTIASEARRLAEERAGLRCFRTGELALDGVFQAGYDQLDPAAARAFRLLAGTGLPELPLAAAAVALGCAVDEAEELCEGLVDRGMLESIGRGRYRYHELMRMFALGHGSRSDETDVLARLLDHYLATMKTVLRVRHPGLVLPSTATESAGERLRDLEDTRRFLERERRNIAALYRLAAAATPRHRVVAADLAITVAVTLLAGDATADLEQALDGLIVATAADGNAAACRRARLALAFALLVEFGEPERAAAELRQILDGIDPSTEIWVGGAAHLLTGALALGEGEVDAAIDSFGMALRLHRLGNSPECVRVAYAMLARAYAVAGRDRDALAAAARAVVGDQRPGTRHNIMWALTEAAWVICRENDPDLGQRLFDAALTAARRAGSPRFESAVHTRAALANLAAGRLREAVDAADRAEATRGPTRTTHPHNQLIRYTALRRLGRTLDAAECYRTAASQIPDFDTALASWTATIPAATAAPLPSAS
ncbi:Regulatory protein AfsR [Nocardia otitidiscaviarum]|uniref:Regulatory protein AfsR n=3 Tax=Nocardia otitidiscaviarum TaxID=1823 RepID=A0A378YS90_9NOCA|nr:BTAD domain-containing putative transcriptional regulator [Nocardia otitidiscaviarum]SUA79678.1 Regulatory protein AfsR [Nocardia otitidiscaviarum]